MNESMKYTVETGASISGIISQEVSAVTRDGRERLSRQLIDIKEAQVHDTLVALGWTPPREVRWNPYPEYQGKERRNAKA